MCVQEYVQSMYKQFLTLKNNGRFKSNKYY